MAQPPSMCLLQPGQEPLLDRFLRKHNDSSVFLRSNLRRGGIAYNGNTYSANYAAVVERGEISAVAAHCWNGNLLLQAPWHVEPVARYLVQQSGRSVKGIAGPLTQVDEARRALRMEQTRAVLETRDDLFSLELADLDLPESLARASLRCVHATAEHIEPLTGFRIAYSIETLGAADCPDLRAGCRADTERGVAAGDAWLLFDRDRPVACSMFNARLPDTVQVGGVYTPPALRRRTYGRAVVAGSLVDVHASGVDRAVLFTDEGNAPAQTAYRALGFRHIGDYALTIFSH